jgi:hypothetical protein
MCEKRILRKIFGLKREDEKGVCKNCVMYIYTICTLQKYCKGDQLEENERGGIHDANG